MNSNMVLSGSIEVNGRSSHEVDYCQAYVQQEDAFFSMLTAEEVS